MKSKKQLETQKQLEALASSFLLTYKNALFYATYIFLMQNNNYYKDLSVSDKKNANDNKDNTVGILDKCSSEIDPFIKNLDTQLNEQYKGFGGLIPLLSVASIKSFGDYLTNDNKEVKDNITINYNNLINFLLESIGWCKNAIKDGLNQESFMKQMNEITDIYLYKTKEDIKCQTQIKKLYNSRVNTLANHAKDLINSKENFNKYSYILNDYIKDNKTNGHFKDLSNKIDWKSNNLNTIEQGIENIKNTIEKEMEEIVNKQKEENVNKINIINFEEEKKEEQKEENINKINIINFEEEKKEEPKEENVNKINIINFEEEKKEEPKIRTESRFAGLFKQLEQLEFQDMCEANRQTALNEKKIREERNKLIKAAKYKEEAQKKANKESKYNSNKFRDNKKSK